MMNEFDAFGILLLLMIVLDIVIDVLRRKSSRTATREAVLLEDCKELKKRAELLLSPATFAASAKLSRAAAVKEKEIAALQESATLSKGEEIVVRFAERSKDAALAVFALLHWLGMIPTMVVAGPLLGQWLDSTLLQLGAGAAPKKPAALPVGYFALCVLARRATPCLARLVTTPGMMLAGGATGGPSKGGMGGGASRGGGGISASGESASADSTDDK